MKKNFTILIVDKKTNVLAFLKRELVKEGYKVLTANNARTFMKLLNDDYNPDILIVDPDLPGLDRGSFFRELKKQNPLLPIIIHTYMSDFYDKPVIMENVIFIEKEGSSIENMKKAISDVINKVTEC